MPWLSVLSNGTWKADVGSDDFLLKTLLHRHETNARTFRMKQNSELRLPESVPIWMVLVTKQEEKVELLF